MTEGDHGVILEEPPMMQASTMHVDFSALSAIDEVNPVGGVEGFSVLLPG